MACGTCLRWRRLQRRAYHRREPMYGNCIAPALGKTPYWLDQPDACKLVPAIRDVPCAAFKERRK